MLQKVALFIRYWKFIVSIFIRVDKFCRDVFIRAHDHVTKTLLEFVGLQYNTRSAIDFVYLCDYLHLPGTILSYNSQPSSTRQQ